MTNNEILAMEPGRDLDRIIANKIFGFETREGESWCLDGDTVVFVLEFSTDMTAAWVIVEKLLEDAAIDIEVKNTFYREWMVVIRNDEKVIALAEAKTAPEAICKAALLACIKEATQCK